LYSVSVFCFIGPWKDRSSDQTIQTWFERNKCLVTAARTSRCCPFDVPQTLRCCINFMYYWTGL